MLAKTGTLHNFSTSSAVFIVVSNIFKINMYAAEITRPIRANIAISFGWFILDGPSGNSASSKTYTLLIL